MPDARLEKGQDSKKEIFTVRDFKGANTIALRTAIGRDEFAWLENWMPTGYGNLQTVPAPTNLGTNYSTQTYSVQFVSIGGNDTLLIFRTNGDLIAVKTDGTSSVLLAAATFDGATTRVTTWKNNQALFIDGNGYFSWDGVFAPGHVTHITGAGVPTAGTDIAVYAGRVWIAGVGSTGRTIFFSGPDDYTAAAWAAAVGAGSVIISDSTLRGNITRLFAANGYLYIFGQSSIDVISDVRVPAGATPPLPVFTRININAIIGTTFPNSVTIFNRSVCFANQYGFFSLDGVTVRRLSEAISGTIQNIEFAQGVSAGTAIINNILCLCFSFVFFDPILLMARPLLAIYFDGRWYFSTQVDAASGVTATTVVQVVSSFLNNSPALSMLVTVGSNNNIFVGFQDASVVFDRTIRTALWPGHTSVQTKQSIRVGLEMTFASTLGATEIQVDSEIGVSAVSIVPVTPVANVSSLLWVNGSSVSLTWQNAATNTLLWNVTGSNVVITNLYGLSATNVGRYLGITLTSTVPSAVVSAFHLEYENRKYWGNPTGSVL